MAESDVSAKTFMEAAPGKHTHNSKAMKVFKVRPGKLALCAQLGNTDQLFGDVLAFTMNYFIADDTVTVIQSRVELWSRVFPPLNRERLLKDPSQYLELTNARLGITSQEKYGLGMNFALE